MENQNMGNMEKKSRPADPLNFARYAMMAFVGIFMLFVIINAGRYVYSITVNEYYTPQTAYVVYNICGFCMEFFSLALLLVGLGLIRKFASFASLLVGLGVAAFLFCEIYFQVGIYVLETLVP